MKKKIAIFNLNTYPEISGGSERSCIELAKALNDNGENAAVISLNAFTDGYRNFTYEGVTINKLPLLNLYWPTTKKKRNILLKAVWNIIDIANIPMALSLCIWLKKRKYDVVHTNNIKGASPWVFPMLKLFGFRVVHTTRDFYLLDRGAWYRDLNSEHNTFKLKLERLNKLWCSSFVDCVVFNSEYMQKYHTACGFFKKTEKKVIYNGFNPDVYSNKQKNNAQIKAFGYIGRLSPEKGLDLLFDNFVKFEPNAYKLIIAGATRDDFIAAFPEREDILKGRDDIDFIGIVNNITFYDKVDCVIVPSKYNEPFGRVAMEAIFMGKSVIVSEKGGLPEQIFPGVNGVVCANEDYFTAMKKITKNSKYNFETNAGQPDLTRFTLEFSAKEYLSAFNRG
ncbi:glycosyltransferase [Edaphovirga cremea]|uniref:glycosyltransferase n=1 Tax=Edaphovirga cremea TaxID=2267246 RepID=UPI003989E40B